MPPPKPTAQDMQDVLDFAQKRGISGKFWDAQKRWLVLARESDGQEEAQAQTGEHSTARPDQAGDGGDGA